MPKYTAAYDDAEEEAKETKQEGNKALISREALGGKKCKVGDTITFKVTAIFDDEIQGEVSGYKETEDEDEGDEKMEGEESAPPAEDMQESMDDGSMPSGPMPAYD